MVTDWVLCCAVLCLQVTGQSLGVSSHLVVETRVKLHLMEVLGITQHCLATPLHGSTLSSCYFVIEAGSLKTIKALLVVTLGHLRAIQKGS